MSLTSAMLVGYSGIQSNGVTVDTVGDNIANVNTTAFKSQRTLFETLLYQTLSEGQAPSETSGGTLPEQIGKGSTVASIQRNFEQGGIDQTAFPSDLAIDGEGFFILQPENGDPVFTRDGSFRLDETQTLVSANGVPVQIFPPDENGAIDQGTMSNLVIPLGTAAVAAATTNVHMEGDLDAGTTVASAGAVVVSQPLFTASGAAATDSTGLSDLVDVNGLPLFTDGDELVIRADKGGAALPVSTFTVGTTGRTLGDLARYLQTVLGINTDPATGGASGVTISGSGDMPAGTLVVTSNLGESNAISLDAGSITNTTGLVASPFSFATTTQAVGGGEATSFTVYDSLGSPLEVRVRVALESRSDGGTVWRFHAESTDDTDLSPIIGTGTITFDAHGRFVGATGTDVSIDRGETGAETPLDLALDFSGLTGLTGPDGTSVLQMASQDGAGAGVMVGYSVDADGIITATYSNQREQLLVQVR